MFEYEKCESQIFNNSYPTKLPKLILYTDDVRTIKTILFIHKFMQCFCHFVSRSRLNLQSWKLLKTFWKLFRNFLKLIGNFLKLFGNFLKLFGNFLKLFGNFVKLIGNFKLIGNLLEIFKNFWETF